MAKQHLAQGKRLKGEELQAFSDSEKEKIATFYENLNRIIPNASNDITTGVKLRNVITVESSDITDIVDTLTDKKQYDYFTEKNQYLQYGITLRDAYQYFVNNFDMWNYHINSEYVTDGNYTWDINIGTDSRSTLGTRNYSGSIDELRFWNYARTPQQIKQYYNLILNTTFENPLKSLIGYYRFDDGINSNVVTDIMSGKYLKSVTKFVRNRCIMIDDNVNVREIDESKEFIFSNNSYFGNQGVVNILNSDNQTEDKIVNDSDILIDVNKIEWGYSGANMIGYGDDRYVVETPPSNDNVNVISPQFNKSLTQLNSRITPSINIKDSILDVSRKSSVIDSTINSNAWWNIDYQLRNLPQTLQKYINRTVFKTLFKI
jgi:hypothetical protein